MKRFIIYFSFMLLYILSGCSDEPMTQHFGGIDEHIYR